MIGGNSQFNAVQWPYLGVVLAALLSCVLLEGVPRKQRATCQECVLLLQAYCSHRRHLHHLFIYYPLPHLAIPQISVVHHVSQKYIPEGSQPRPGLPREEGVAAVCTTYVLIYSSTVTPPGSTPGLLEGAFRRTGAFRSGEQGKTNSIGGCSKECQPALCIPYLLFFSEVKWGFFTGRHCKPGDWTWKQVKGG